MNSLFGFYFFEIVRIQTSFFHSRSKALNWRQFIFSTFHQIGCFIKSNARKKFFSLDNSNTSILLFLCLFCCFELETCMNKWTKTKNESIILLCFIQTIPVLIHGIFFAFISFFSVIRFDSSFHFISINTYVGVSFMFAYNVYVIVIE